MGNNAEFKTTFRERRGQGRVWCDPLRRVWTEKGEAQWVDARVSLGTMRVTWASPGGSR